MHDCSHRVHLDLHVVNSVPTYMQVGPSPPKALLLSSKSFVVVWILDFHANIYQNRGLLVKTYTGMYLSARKRFSIAVGRSFSATTNILHLLLRQLQYFLINIEGASIVVLVHISIYTTAANTYRAHARPCDEHRDSDH
jgi:hypothetical protein